MKTEYSLEIGLKHNEKAAKLNVETGEIKIIENRPNNIPDGKEVFEPNGIFQKNYTVSWKYLESETSNLEFAAAMRMALMAKANTNSLEPLNDNATIDTLVEVLGVSENKVKVVLKKLFELGVYGKFEIVDMKKGYTKYWLFNPYLSFSGKLINSDIAELFSGTRIASAYIDAKKKK